MSATDLLLELLPRLILVPDLDPYNATTVMDHCYPSLYRILYLQAGSRPLASPDHPTVYLQLYYKLAEAQKNSEWARRAGWKGGVIIGQSDERAWSVCVDIEPGRHTEVFIGNGFPSLTTQVIALRLR